MASTTSQQLIIPDYVLESIGKDDDSLRLELALFFYKEFDLSTKDAAKFAGISQVAFQRELGRRRIAVHYDESDALHDVETMKDFDEEFPLSSK